MEIYCSDNCRTIFNTLTEYNAENITAREAAERMKDCDMSDVSKFHEVNQKMIAKIQKETADIKLQKISEKDPVSHCLSNPCIQPPSQTPCSLKPLAFYR